jgi:ABC-type proline/glycine betaine transport system permease subunit
VKRFRGFINVFGSHHHLGVVTVRIASVPAVSVGITVSRIRLDDGLDPGFVQNALGFPGMLS